MPIYLTDPAFEPLAIAALSFSPYSVEVKEKIVILGEGERDRQLFVKHINILDGTVTVSYAACSYFGNQEVEVIMRTGDSVVVQSYARVYLQGFENGKAVFGFEATGGGFCR